MKKKRITDADRLRWEQVLANAERTRKLAERGQAELDRRKRERESA